MEMWGEATEEEREELMQAMVARVEMTEKGKGACQIAVLPEAPSGWLELSSDMGAGGRVIANNAALFAPIITEQAILNPSREQRRALYATWPVEATAGQRPRPARCVRGADVM